ncbi:diguanylate cyclase [Chitinivorax sp. PXF-14]|uniref:sensor domain-containing diguanylate cyclase n=1 Tax=Chitinivorax sp. PXF-14 TaxID=3230488 RepID=UPI003467075E
MTRKLLDRFSIASLLHVGIVALTATLLAVLLAVIDHFASRYEQDEAGHALSLLARQMSSALDQGMFERYQDIHLISNLYGVRQDGQDIRVALANLAQLFPYYAWIGLAGPDGKVLYSPNGLLEGGDVSKRPWFREGLKAPYVGDVHEAVLLAKLLPAQHEPWRFVDFSAPLHDSEGRVTGVVGAHLSWKWARDVRESMFSPGEQGYRAELLLVRGDGTVLIGPPPLEGKRIPADLLRRVQQRGPVYQHEQWPDGAFLSAYAQTVGYGAYPGLGWFVLARQHDAVAYAAYHDLQWRVALLAGLAGLIFVALGSQLANWLSAPLLAIAKAAACHRDGQQSVEIPVVGGYREAHLLSTMLVGLMAREKAAITELEQLNAALEQRVAERTGELVELTDDLQSALSQKVRLEQEREHLIAELSELAQTDALTGVLNRRAFFGLAERELLRQARTGSQLSVIMLDIDHFKCVNDEHGHGVGDEVIRVVAACCKAQLRELDLFARYGGEEFCVLLPDTPLNEARQVGERLRLAVEAAPAAVGDLHVTISLGVAASGTGPGEIESMLEAADRALYVAKRNGRNRIEVIDAEAG